MGPAATPAFTGGDPPAPHAGDISPLTEALRPRIRLTRDQCKEARRLGRLGVRPEDVALQLGEPEEQVKLAMATLRTTVEDATRATLNVTMGAREFVATEAIHGESVWQTVDRLFIELAFRRALMS